MPRRKIAEVETLSPEEEQPKGGRKKLVQAKHRIEYDAPVAVAVEEAPEEELVFDEEIEEAEEKRRRKPVLNEREKLRKILSMSGVTPASPLKLIIERYLHSEAADSGTMAEKEYCTKYACNQAHITNQDYLDVANSKWGPGRYWFTLYLNSKIVTQWEKRLGTAIMPTRNDMVIPSADPTQPAQIIYPIPNQPAMPMQVPLTFNDYLKQMAQTKKLMDEISGTPVQPIQPPQLSEEVQLATMLLKDPANVKAMAKKLLGKDDEQSLITTLIENGPTLIQAATNGIRAIIADVTRARIQNGQAQVASQTQPMDASTQAPRGQMFQQGTQSEQSSDLRGMAGSNRQDGNMGETQEQFHTAQPATEEQLLNQLLSFVIQQCQLQTKPEDVADAVVGFLDQVRSDYPLSYLTINSRVDLFASVPVEAALEFVKTLSNGETITSLPHAKEWTAKLQEALKESEEGEDG